MTLLFIYIFIVGVLVGSFLNVVALRFNTGLSFTKGRSICFSCGMPLKWFDLVPLFSFLFLGGKCRKCKSPISWQYPFVEFFTGVIFLGIAIRQYMYWPLYGVYEHGLTYSILFFLFYAFVFSVLIVISLYDLRHKIIPNELVFTFIFLSIIKLFVFFYCTGFNTSLIYILDLLSPFLLPVPFALIWYFSRGKWIGFGDIKLMCGIGALLGFALGLSAIIMAFWIGAVWGVLAILYSQFRYSKKSLSHRVAMGSEIPFAPFLIAGTVLAFFTHIDIFGITQFLLYTIH